MGTAGIWKRLLAATVAFIRDRLDAPTPGAWRAPRWGPGANPPRVWGGGHARATWTPYVNGWQGGGPLGHEQRVVVQRVGGHSYPSSRLGAVLYQGRGRINRQARGVCCVNPQSMRSIVAVTGTTPVAKPPPSPVVQGLNTFPTWACPCHSSTGPHPSRSTSTTESRYYCPQRT